MQYLVTVAAREARVRRLANRHGLALRKSRLRGLTHIDDWGGYMLIEPERNYVYWGERFDLSLDDIEAHLDHIETDQTA